MNAPELAIKEPIRGIVENFAEEAVNKLDYINSYLLEKFENLHHEGLQEAQDVENEADQYIAKEWVGFIKTNFPFFNIDTEETLGKIDIGSQYTVRIDSIDGSKHFRAGIPIFGSNISLRLGNETLFGACSHPIFRETYYALKGQGAYRNNQRISVSSVESVRKGFIALEGPTSKLAQTNPDIFRTALTEQDMLKQTCFRVRDFGLGAFGICLVARGACAAYVDLSGTTKIYDVEAALLILQEAGGVYTDIIRQPLSCVEIQTTSDLSNHVTIATNGYVHEELLSILQAKP